MSVIYPIFEECKKYTLDPYWKDKFTNFAHNKFPSEIKYDPVHKNLILKLDGKKREVIGLPDDDPIFTFQVVMKILRENLNMNSNRDIKFRKEEMEIACQKNVCDLDCEWKKIKPRHLKDQFIMDYIAKLKEEHNLSSQEVKELISVVHLGFQFKALSQDGVDFSDGAVQNIEGLTFDENTRKFKIPEYAVCGKTVEKIINPDRFVSTLKKFIRDDSLRRSKFA